MQARPGGRELAFGDVRAIAAAALYDLSVAQICEGAQASGRDPMAIVTASEEWAYAVTVPLNLSQFDRSARFRVKIRLSVHQGCIGVGILQRDEAGFFEEVSVGVAGSSSWREIVLATPSLDAAGPLVVRNHSASGASRVQLRITEIAPIADDLDRPEMPAPLDRPERRRLGPLLSGLSVDALVELAESMAGEPRLEPVPGWRFDAFATSPDPAVHLRDGLWCAAKDQGCDRAVTVPWHEGTRLALHFDNDLSRTLYASGCYEPNEFALLGQVLEPGMVFLDGGANEGVYTVFAAARVGPSGRVIAVEPSPRELERLRANLAINRAANLVVVDAPLAERATPVRLTLAEAEHSGQNTLGGFIYQGVDAIGERCVCAVTIDDLAQTHRLSRLDIVKLDLEGAELRALIGARNTLREMKPLLQVEVSDAALARQAGSCVALCDLLKRADYVPLSFDDTGFPVPWTQSGKPLSQNIVAVHRRRDFGLLAKPPRGADRGAQLDPIAGQAARPRVKRKGRS